MTLPTSYRLAIGCVAWALAATTLAAKQDSLARAKDFYASAAYEEALQVLDHLQSASPTADSTEVAAYQVFCLVALGRSDEATHAIEAIVKNDPLYRPSESQASPRVRTFFENVRRPLLPDVVRDSYNKGREAFTKKDMAAATAEFDQVIALIDELGTQAEPGLVDLRTLASGFRDLSKNGDAPVPVSATAVPAPAPAPTVASPTPVTSAASDSSSGPERPPTPSAARNDAGRVYTAADADVSKPVPVSQMLPVWNPANPVDKIRDFRGTIEIVVDTTGKVSTATVTKTVNAVYDPLLLKAAAQWQYKPATRNGVPVNYRYAVDIHLGR